MQKLIAIVGPTATGKSDLSFSLAADFNGEIINADSRQIYRRMDIGTAKPSSDEFNRFPHHLFNVINPDQSFSLAEYQSLAIRTIRDIQSRKKMPLLVGGSGQYVWAVIENWQLPRVPPNPRLRQELEEKAAKAGNEPLFQELERLDPVAARRIGQFNTRRIIRALEVYYTTGIPLSRQQTKNNPLFDALIIGLTRERKTLYRKIDQRVDQMIEHGLVAEVENLVKMGYDFSLPAMSAIGYRQVGFYLKGEISLEEAVRQIKYETHRYVRRQYNWFRLSDPKIHWFNADLNQYQDIQQLVGNFLNQGSSCDGQVQNNP